MKTVAIDTEYDYCKPFLATVTDEKLHTTVYRLSVLSQKRALQKICEDRMLRKVFHHAVGDIFILRCVGIRVVEPYECTLIASNLVNEQYSSRNLKKLAQGHLGIETKESNRLRGLIKKYKERAKEDGRRFQWSEIPDEYIIPYAKRDPEYTLQLWYYWQTPIKECWALYEFEKKLIPLLVEMQMKGMRVHRPLCYRILCQYREKIETLIKQMNQYLLDHNLVLDKKFNPNSVSQVQKIIKEMGLEWEVGRNEKTGSLKTGRDELQKLGIKNEFFRDLLSYRFFVKHVGTYYEPLYQYYTNGINDRAHFMVYQTGAKTGRFSAELIQTFPRPEENALVKQKHEVRKVIIPGNGKVLLCKDYEQQEMRLFIHYSDCRRMIDLINKKGGRGVDCYAETAHILFGKLYEDERYRKLLRYVAKTHMLGMIYGEGVKKLVSSTVTLLNARFGQSMVGEIGVNEKWAYHVLQKCHELYPIRQYMDREIKQLYQMGYLTMQFDSPLMKFTRKYYVEKDKAYKAVNVKIQGTAAYVIKYAMLRVYNRIKEIGWGKKVEMLMQVHDELIFEVDEDMDLLKVNEVLSEEMEDHMTFKVPITTSAKWSEKSWGEMKDMGDL